MRFPGLLSRSVLMIAVWMLVTAFEFGPGSRIELEGFRTFGTGDDGKTEWELVGEKALLIGSTYELTDVDLVIFLEADRARITSPRCVYNQNTGLAKGESPVRVVTRDMLLEGVGYDVLAASKRLRIRSEVHMKIRRAGAIGLPGAPSGAESDPAGDQGVEAPGAEPAPVESR